MKVIQNIKSKGLKSIKLPVLALALAVGFSSCKDDNEPFVPSQSAIAIFHSATDTEGVNFIFDKQTLNKKDELVTYGENLVLKENENYIIAAPSEYTVEVTDAEDATLLEGKVSLENLKAYSLFIVKENDKLEFVKFEDNLTRPEAGKAKIRFVHLSSDGGKLNFAIVNAEETPETHDVKEALFADRDFKTASEFKEIAAEKTSFNVIDQVSGEVVFTLTDVELKTGKVYTVWVKGLKGAENEDNKFEAVVFNNI